MIWKFAIATGRGGQIQSTLDEDWLSGGFHSHGGTPRKIVYFMENPIYKWMMTRGTPMTQETDGNMAGRLNGM